MNTDRTAYYVDQQERAHEFSVGDVVIHTGQTPSRAGRVVQVWPAIGYVDVEWSWGSSREAVEELTRLNPENGAPIPPRTQNVPGGVGTAPVSGGPPTEVVPSNSPSKAAAQEVASEVADAFARRMGLYWSGKGRRYRPSKAEKDSGEFLCPKCKGTLRKAIYRREKQISERLLACEDCIFLVCEDHIDGIEPFNRRPDPEPPVLPKQRPGVILKYLEGS